MLICFPPCERKLFLVERFSCKNESTSSKIGSVITANHLHLQEEYLEQTEGEIEKLKVESAENHCLVDACFL